MPLDELRMAKFVVIEVPSKAAGGLERLLLKLAQKILMLGPQVAILALPAAKQQAHTTLWVNRWNRHETVITVSVPAYLQLSARASHRRAARRDLSCEIIRQQRRLCHLRRRSDYWDDRPSSVAGVGRRSCGLDHPTLGYRFFG